MQPLQFICDLKKNAQDTGSEIRINLDKINNQKWYKTGKKRSHVNVRIGQLKNKIISGKTKTI